MAGELEINARQVRELLTGSSVKLGSSVLKLGKIEDDDANELEGIARAAKKLVDEHFEDEDEDEDADGADGEADEELIEDEDADLDEDFDDDDDVEFENDELDDEEE